MLAVAALAGFLVAGFAAIAGGKSFTLRVVKNVHVNNTGLAKSGIPVTKMVNVNENVAVGARGFAVYTFQGETTHHLICKKTTKAATDCWAFWPPVTVRSAKGLSAQPGIKGKLGTFRNHGVRQLTLGGRPLYYFMPDISGKNKKQAMGDELKTFGSVWHIVKAAGRSTSHRSTSTSTSTTGTSSSPSSPTSPTGTSTSPSTPGPYTSPSSPTSPTGTPPSPSTSTSTTSTSTSSSMGSCLYPPCY